MIAILSSSKSWLCCYGFDRHWFDIGPRVFLLLAQLTWRMKMKKFLLASVMLVAFALPATAGYWRYEHSRDMRGRETCYAYTQMTNGGVLGIGINGQNQELYTYIHKNSWDIPKDQEVNIGVSIDDSESVSAPAHVDSMLSSTLIIPVKQEYTRLFVHLVTAGHNLYIRFHGSEPDWNLSLLGSSDTYDQFFNCARRIAPDWAWRNRPRPPEATQPY
jgi:hypothetical protein